MATIRWVDADVRYGALVALPERGTPEWIELAKTVIAAEPKWKAPNPGTVDEDEINEIETEMVAFKVGVLDSDNLYLHGYYVAREEVV
jgi:hypothetical protein